MQTIDRNTFCQRLYQCMFQHRVLLSGTSDLAAAITEHLKSFEASVFIGQLMMLMVRGASASDCTRYAATGEPCLPFEGCEQHLFDELLIVVNQRAGAESAASTLVDNAASWMSNVLSFIEQETGIPRTEIIPLFRSEAPRD